MIPKPARGSAARAKAARRAKVVAAERQAKAAVRVRDGDRCRWPGCEWQTHRVPIEVAHIQAKGMGGDGGTRSTTVNLVCLCREHHQGRWSVHSGHLAITWLTDRGADGPLAFVSTHRTHIITISETVEVQS